MGFLDRFRKSGEAEPKPEMGLVQKVTTPWDKGYKIQNRYEIVDIKKGGMGIVYVVNDCQRDGTYAVKTFQDKFIWNEDGIQRFMAEAETWIKLERHTNIVYANWVQIIDGKPRLFLEYIDHGNLEQFIGNFTIEESLDYAIQFCTGMEYAYQKLGVIHRDIKPANVMVQKDPRFRFGRAFKITDFGLVKVLGDEFQGDFVEVSTGMGTLPFMPPEQFPERIQEKFSFKGQVTTRSDTYSFGVTLYLLLTGKLPCNDLTEIFTTPPERPKNLNPKILDSLDILIIQCLEKSPHKRYTDFTELKEKLIEIYNDFTRESYTVIGKKEELTDRDWTNKGGALDELGKPQEAIGCFDKALEINPRYAAAWNHKGLALDELGKPEEAIGCYDKALEINPIIVEPWLNKGNAIKDLGKPEEAIGCYDRALSINPRYVEAWNNKALALEKLGKPEEAIGCYDRALSINPRSDGTWNNKGHIIEKLGKPEEAIGCYDKALSINPRSSEAWGNKGNALSKLGKPQEAIGCFDKALFINPRLDSSWNNKGNILLSLGKPQEAIVCYDKALEINSRSFDVWTNKGAAFAILKKPQEAIECHNKALEINPRSYVVWGNKGLAFKGLGKNQEAIKCFEKFIELAPPQCASDVERVKQIINQLR